MSNQDVNNHNTSLKERVDDKWHTYAIEQEQKRPEELAKTAKFLMPIVTAVVLITLLVVMDRPERVFDRTPMVIVALILWVGSLITCIWGLLPTRNLFDPESIMQIKMMHQRIVRQKDMAVRLSAMFLLLGILAIFFNIIWELA